MKKEFKPVFAKIERKNESAYAWATSVAHQCALTAEELKQSTLANIAENYNKLLFKKAKKLAKIGKIKLSFDAVGIYFKSVTPGFDKLYVIRFDEATDPEIVALFPMDISIEEYVYTMIDSDITHAQMKKQNEIDVYNKHIKEINKDKKVLNKERRKLNKLVDGVKEECKCGGNCKRAEAKKEPVVLLETPAEPAQPEAENK